MLYAKENLNKQEVLIGNTKKIMMTINEIIERNYNATCLRGLITPETCKQEFTVKMVEEIDELNNEICFENSENEPVELADVILVCLSYAKHFNIDILTELEKKTLYNETRK